MLNRLKELFRSFQEHEAKYLVIGGIASVLHGVPRATFDLDILIEATPENVERLLNSMIKVGLGTALLTDKDKVLSNEITIFKDKVRIDVQTSTPGISFKEAWNRKETMKFQGQVFYVLSKADLIASKKAAGRKIDLEDVEALESN
jgi:tRNA nucleotidyltransferase/poly(A) polymerase